MRAPAQRLRASVFAIVATGVGVVAHLAGGGALPPAGLLSAVLMLAALGATPLADRERGPGTLLLGCAVVQLGLHVALAGSMHDMHGSAHGPAMPAPGGALVPAGWMLLAHVLATLLVAGGLRLGERALWAAARCLAAVVALPPVAPVLPVVAPARPRPEAVPRRPAATPLLRALLRRGPPLPGARPATATAS